MNNQEKILLLQLLLEDIRGNWGWEHKSRSSKAIELAKELGLNKHVERISDYRKWGEKDGRHFRISVEHGGYEGMDALHGLTKSINDKSDEFKKLALEYLTYPEYRFEDWNEYIEG